MACPAGTDLAFGPRVDSRCRSFDFTLAFEDVFFACLPAAIFLAIAPAKILSRLRRPCLRPTLSKILSIRLIILTLLLGLQLALVVIRYQWNHLRTSASLAGGILTTFATITVIVLSVLDNQRSLRSSSLNTLNLSAYVLLGTARARTLWLIDGSNEEPAILAISSLVLASAALAIDFLERLRMAEPNAQKYAPEQYSTFWSRAIFIWLRATFQLGFATVMTPEDLPTLDSNLRSDNSHRRLLSRWKGATRTGHTLLKACLRSYIFSFLSAIAPRLALSLFTFSQPFLLNATISLAGDKHPSVSYGRSLIGAWAIVMLGIAFSKSIYDYQSFRFVTRVRGGLTALVYERSLQVREMEHSKVTAVAILGADIQQITSGLRSIHELWASLVDVAIATWLLERKLSLACLAPSVLVLICIGTTTRISNVANKRQRCWIEKVQQRLKVTRSVLESTKAVKMLGLTDVVRKMIQNLRQEEIVASTSYRRVLLRIVMLSGMPSSLAPTLTFSVYVLISVYWKGSSLNVAQAFNSLSLISLLTAPIVLFIQILPRVRQMSGCFDRIQEYCQDDIVATTSTSSTEKIILSSEGVRLVDNPQHSDRLPPSNLNSPAVCEVMPNETAKSEVKSQVPCVAVTLQGKSFQRELKGPTVLRNIDLKFTQGSFTALVGPVGCGKSALLESILKETVSELKLGLGSSVRAAYCSQEPWLENKTIRENIIGQNLLDDKWYATVKQACDLDGDIDRQPQGDLTRVGSKGIGLSGGQKQRVALARAVYSRQNIVLLDDVFSGMDARTTGIVSRRLLQPDGIWRRHGTTVILATTNRKIIALADNVVVLHKGEVMTTGPPNTFLGRDDHTSMLGLQVSDESENNIPVEDDAHIAAPQQAKATAIASEDEQRKKGDLSIYKFYFANSGIVFVGGYLACVTLSAILSGISTIWLMLWSADNEASPNHKVGMYIGVYAMLGCLGIACGTMAVWLLLVRMVSVSSNRLHSHLLNATIKAPFSFFTTTDTGELMNRFSQDMELIDMGIPTTLAYYLSSIIQCFVKLVILFVFSRYLGAAVPILVTVLYLIQMFYLRTSRQVRLLGIEAKAPLYTHFMDSTDLQGATTIRAFGWQRAYQERLYHLLDTWQRPEYLQNCIQTWLIFVLDTVVAALAVILVATIVFARDKFNAGDVGVSFVMVIGFSATLMGVIQAWTLLESSIGAVARVKRFVDETETEDGQCSGTSQSADVQTGSLQVSGLCASHGPSGQMVLNNVSIHVQDGQHVAICGRSGSGKTSLMLSILKMMVTRSGRVQIGNIDLTTLTCQGVRDIVNVVPQDPLLFQGTVRFNCDPFECASDDQIISALTRVGLWAIVCEQGGLDQTMDTTAWSSGQRQLFCLARAMLKKSKILILDEAMSSVDRETETVMQNIIDTEFKDTTVLAVMHKLEHVMKYEKVALMDNGSLAEFDNPRRLIEQESSRFGELWKTASKW